MHRHARAKAMEFSSMHRCNHRFSSTSSGHQFKNLTPPIEISAVDLLNVTRIDAIGEGMRRLKFQISIHMTKVPPEPLSFRSAICMSQFKKQTPTSCSLLSNLPTPKISSPLSVKRIDRISGIRSTQQASHALFIIATNTCHHDGLPRQPYPYSTSRFDLWFQHVGCLTRIGDPVLFAQ